MKTLEQEIQKATSKIEDKKSIIDNEIQNLNSKINIYTKWAWTFVWVGIIVTLFAIIFYISENNETGFGLNLLGDFMAGTVASVWSLAGLFFIYVAFLGQKQQLLNQQLEIMFSQLEVKYTRLELAGQKEEMKEQNATLKQQKFENTFFQLLANHNTIVNSLDLSGSGSQRAIIATGRDCFVVFYSRLNAKLPGGVTLTLNMVINSYLAFFKENVADLGHYFRNLYHIIKFVDTSDIEDKKQYTNFVRAQLSAGELIILFYNCLSEYGFEKFKPLIEKYSLLKNIDDSLIFNLADKDVYEKTAFH
ncbi:MAG: putative phage abortive infection protein [Bacteroidales bacterium]|nr:putative phage abortive infection protein [Bacteroidales bacterium]